MCFISNISLMNIAPTSEFCVFKSMWRSWRRLWHCSYLYCAICMVHVSNGVEPVVWRQIISHWSNYSDVTWASWRLKSTGACWVEQQINIVSEIHQWAVGFPHKGPVMEKIPVFLHEEPLWWEHIINSNVDVMTWIRFPPHICQWNPPVTVGYPRNWSVMFNHPPSSSWQQFDTTWCSCDVTIMINEQSTSMC